jgi:hypothetical protein
MALEDNLRSGVSDHPDADTPGLAVVSKLIFPEIEEGLDIEN